MEGKYYNKNGGFRLDGAFNENELIKLTQKQYGNIIIQKGKYKNYFLYSGTVYLKNNEQDNKINPDNLIYTLTRDETNPNIRTLTFFTTNEKIGLNRDIQIHIDENNIATLQGKPLTEEEIDKIRKFFKNISIEQLEAFDPYLATLYYTIIMDKNKDKYQDTNVLIPDLCECKYKESEEVNQTINLINKIPQNKRTGKYIVPCGWLRLGHRVNLRIDFDNKICEIVNTGNYVKPEVLRNLQTALDREFPGFIVFENNIIAQSVGNCVIASNIVATEKTVMEKKLEEYDEKKKQLEEIDKKTEANIKQKYETQYKNTEAQKEEQIKKLQTKLETKEKKYHSFVNENSLSEDKEYEELRQTLFSPYTIYIKWNKVEKEHKRNDKTKLNYIFEEINKRIETTKDSADIKRYKNIQTQIQQALYLLDIQELKNKIANLKKEG